MASWLNRIKKEVAALVTLVFLCSGCVANKTMDEVTLNISLKSNKLILSIQNNQNRDVVTLPWAGTKSPYDTYFAFKKCSGETLQLPAGLQGGWWTPLLLVSAFPNQEEYKLNSNQVISEEINVSSIQDVIDGIGGVSPEDICEYNYAIETHTKSGASYRKELGWTIIN